MTSAGRLLVVDDDQILRMTLERLLVHAGFSCDLAADGREGLACLNEAHYDLVITDMRMPNMTGLELIRAALPLRRARYFILLSGFHDTSEHELREAGVALVLSKPMAPQALRQHVRELLRSG